MGSESAKVGGWVGERELFGIACRRAACMRAHLQDSLESLAGDGPFRSRQRTPDFLDACLAVRLVHSLDVHLLNCAAWVAVRCLPLLLLAVLPVVDSSGPPKSSALRGLIRPSPSCIACPTLHANIWPSDSLDISYTLP